MFVRSRMSGPVIYRKCGKSWTIKPYSVTLIDDPRVSARELKMYYGSKIEIISDEVTQETRQPEKDVVKSKVEVKPRRVDESSLDALLDEVNKELGEMKVDTKRPLPDKDNKPSADVKSTGISDGGVSEGKDTEAPKTNAKSTKTRSTKARTTNSKKTTGKKVSKKAKSK